VGVYLYDTNNNQITGNTLTDNGAGITYHNSLGVNLSGNNYTDNWLTDTSTIDDGEMVIATTIYSCGPAALATILKNLGIYSTEGELSKIAGTDETGTSLYGLKQATLNKGLTATGVRLTVDQLQPNYLVVLDIDGTKHFEIIRNLTNTTVYLFDPNLGDLEISRDKFNELYTGCALIINGQAPANTTLLTDDEMRNIKALWHVAKIEHSYWVGGYWVNVYVKVKVTVKIRYPYLQWVPGYLYQGWLPIPGHLEWRVGWCTKTIGMTIRVSRYIPRRKITYYTYKIEPDTPTGKYYNLIGGVKVLKGLSTAYTGTRMATSSVALGVFQPETEPLAYAMFGFGCAGMIYGTYEVWDGADDPIFTDKSYEDQIYENWWQFVP